MKRKSLFVAVSCLLGLCFLLSFAACGGGQIKKEFEHFEKVMLTILNDAKNVGAESSSAAASSASMYGANKPAVTSAASLIFPNRDEIMSMAEQSEKEFSDYGRGEYANALEQNIYVPLYCGYALNNFFGVKSLYNNNLYFESWAQTIRLEQDGGLIEYYCYTDNSMNNGVNRYLKGAVNYVNENDYEFLWYQFDAELDERLFLYGDSDNNFIMATYDLGDSAYPDYNPYEMGNYVYYSDGGSYYALTNESQIFALTEELKPLFEAIDQNKIDGIRDNAQYSLDDGLLIEIMEHYGNYGGGQVEEKGEWSISEDGVLMGYSGGSTPEELVAPAEATAISDYFVLPDGIKKLTLHSGIKSVVIDKKELEQKLAWEKGEEPDAFDQDSEDYETEWVECPARFFEFDARGGTLEEVVTESGCVLETREGGLYYGDTLVFIPSDDSITELTIDADKCAYFLDGGSTPLLKNLRTLEFIGSANANAVGYDGFTHMLRKNSGENALELDRYTLRGLNYNEIRLSDDGSEWEGESQTMALKNATTVELYGDGNADVRVSYPRKQTFETLVIGDGIKQCTLDEDSDEGGKGDGLLGEKTIVLSGEIERLSYNFIMSKDIPHFEYTFELPWTKYEFEQENKYAVLGIGVALDFDYSTLTHELEPGLTLKFKPVSDDEINAAQAAKIFEWDMQTDENGEYIRIYRYKGNSSVVEIPDSINGLPVKYVELGFYMSITQTITELHLPASVEHFEFTEIDSFGTVYYDGNKSDFIAIVLNSQRYTQTPSLRALFDATERIVCGDGEIVPQPAREILTFTEGGGHELTLNVNWQGGVLFEITSASFTPNGQDPISMNIESMSDGVVNLSCTYFGQTETEGYVQNIKYNVHIRLNRIVNTGNGYSEITFESAYINSYGAGSTELNFTLESSVSDIV